MEDEGDGEGWGEGGADGTDEEERRGEEIMEVMEEERGREREEMQEERKETEGEGGGVISKGAEFLSNQRFRKFQTAHSLQNVGVNVSGQNTLDILSSSDRDHSGDQPPFSGGHTAASAQTNVPQRTGHAKPLGAQSRMFRGPAIWNELKGK